MSRRFLKRWLDRKERVKDTFAHSLFGERLFHRDLWHIGRKPLSAGVALGLFVAFTPTFPFQTVIAAACALVLRVNLPAAVIASFVMNPVTAFPVYAIAMSLGEHFAGNFLSRLDGFFTDQRVDSIVKKASYLWIGGLTFSVLSSLAGYILTDLAWRLSVSLRWKNRKKTEVR